MNNTLAVLLAEAVHHWDATTDPDEKQMDIVEARSYIHAFVRLFGIEELAEAIAKRLYEHEVGMVTAREWAELSGAERNNMITKAQNALDALKDELLDNDPLTDKVAEILDRTMAMSGLIRICSWCGREIYPAPDPSLWVSHGERGELVLDCDMSVDRKHHP